MIVGTDLMQKQWSWAIQYEAIEVLLMADGRKLVYSTVVVEQIGFLP